MKSIPQIGTRLLLAVLLSINLYACNGVGTNPNDGAGTSQINSTKSIVTVSSGTTDSMGMIYSTSGQWTGKLGGINGADEKCRNDVKCPAGADCKALIVAPAREGQAERAACDSSDCGVGHNINWVLEPNTKYVFDRSAFNGDGSNIGITNDKAVFESDVTKNFAGVNPPRSTGLKSNWHTGYTCSSWQSNNNLVQSNVDFFNGKRDCPDGGHPILCVAPPLY